jgi:hypothetical protein
MIDERRFFATSINGSYLIAIKNSIDIYFGSVAMFCMYAMAMAMPCVYCLSRKLTVLTCTAGER